MPPREGLDDPRRRLLLRLLAAGAFAATRPAQGGWFGSNPEPMPGGKSIYAMSGIVRVNGASATMDTLITAKDTIETGPRSHAVFVVGKDAFMLRADSRLELTPHRDSLLIDVLRVTTGALLSAFGKSSHRLVTTTATIGIRGTGVYVESNPDETYFCNCYGITEVAALEMPDDKETNVATHHDAPRYIAARGDKRIRPAPFINHTDQESTLLEALVGRPAPFVLPGDSYAAPRRSQY